MTGTQPIFTKLTLTRQFFVKKFNTEFQGSPARDLNNNKSYYSMCFEHSIEILYTLILKETKNKNKNLLYLTEKRVTIMKH